MRKIAQIFSFVVPVIAFVVLVVFMAGCEGQKSAKVEELKNMAHRDIEEAWNKGNLDVLDDFYATDFVYHIPPYPDIKGLEGYKKYISSIRSSYPDVQITIDEIIVEGDICAFRWTYRGTQTGESPTLGIPPTGKQVTFTGCAVFRSVDGKTVETWNYADYVGLMKQLGFKSVPPSE